ncbi:peptide synthetase [Deltaproteobacteria bacterium Smac51]|nr:peptide synthetase [Deltaproteobacteria bacterium Smac51]
MELQVRTYYVVTDECLIEGGKKVDKPTRRAAAAAVIKNPYAGVYQEDLSLLYKWSEDLGEILTKKAVAALGIKPEEVESYGKAAIAGMNGEREHCAALMHPALGKPIRDNVGGGRALLPSAKKMGGPGTAIDLPLGHKDAAFVRSHFDAMEIRIPDAPADDELVLIIGVTNSGRPHPRVGGLQVSEIKGEDGLR